MLQKGAMQLLTEELRQKLPPLYSGEEKGLQALALVKFFTPDGGWTWYASEASVVMNDGSQKALTEVDPNDPDVDDVIFFGLVNGLDVELGYFSLCELKQTRGAFGLAVERDLYYTPKTLGELLEQHRPKAVLR